MVLQGLIIDCGICDNVELIGKEGLLIEEMA